jgi:hypothetical protein
MSGERYSEEFKIEVVKQITERNYLMGRYPNGLESPPRIYMLELNDIPPFYQ